MSAPTMPQRPPPMPSDLPPPMPRAVPVPGGMLLMILELVALVGVPASIVLAGTVSGNLMCINVLVALTLLAVCHIGYHTLARR